MARSESETSQDAFVGIESTLWAAANKLRGHMDAAEYQHVALGLIFLTYISDAFDKRHTEILVVGARLDAAIQENLKGLGFGA